MCDVIVTERNSHAANRNPAAHSLERSSQKISIRYIHILRNQAQASRVYIRHIREAKAAIPPDTDLIRKAN